MDYDFRNRAASPYDPQIPLYRTATSSSSNPMYGGQPLYPRIGQPAHGVTLPVNRHSSHHPTSSSPSGVGIRVVLKPEYRITPPPNLSPHIGEIPRSDFQFDFDLERRILAEAEKENQNWSRLGFENLPSKPPAESPRSSASSGGDPVVSKYTAAGLNKDAVTVAIATYGDNPTKVREFVNGYNHLREMGFSSNNVAEALLMYDNDTEKAVDHLFNSGAH